MLVCGWFHDVSFANLSVFCCSVASHVCMEGAIFETFVCFVFGARFFASLSMVLRRNVNVSVRL